MSIWVKWRAALEDDADFLGGPVKEHETLLPPWADSVANADSVASEVAETWFTPELWEEWFGDDNSAELRVELLAPATVKGIYAVTVERVFKSTVARRTGP